MNTRSQVFRYALILPGKYSDYDLGFFIQFKFLLIFNDNNYYFCESRGTHGGPDYGEIRAHYAATLHSYSNLVYTLPTPYNYIL